MATLDIKACVRAFEEVNQREQDNHRQVMSCAEMIAQRILNGIPEAIRKRQLRISAGSYVRGQVELAALDILRRVSGVVWQTDSRNEATYFWTPYEGLEKALAPHVTPVPKIEPVPFKCPDPPHCNDKAHPECWS